MSNKINIPSSGLGTIVAGRQRACPLLKEMAARKQREATLLEALAALKNLSAEQEEALWSLATGNLHR